VRLLKQRLAEFAAIPSGDSEFYESPELSKILDANVAALARTEAPTALRAIAQHGLRHEKGLEDTRSRLVHLSTVDLLLDLETVSMLVKAIRAELPEKNRATAKGKDLTPLIEALRGTGGETVRLLFHHVAADYPGQPFGAVAASILKERAAGTKHVGAAEKTEGELSIYGIPRLIQSFVAAAATGTLALADESREIQGRLVFQEGRLIDVAAGKLRNAEALYQLIERPVVGSFAFTPRPLPVSSSPRTPADVHALLLEGMRRWDELQPMLALAPDDVAFRPTGSRPTRHPQEDDPQFLRELWVRASSGQPLRTWENEIRADSWRVRRIVARWVEDESLTF